MAENSGVFDFGSSVGVFVQEVPLGNLKNRDPALKELPIWGSGVRAAVDRYMTGSAVLSNYLKTKTDVRTTTHAFRSQVAFSIPTEMKASMLSGLGFRVQG